MRRLPVRRSRVRAAAARTLPAAGCWALLAALVYFADPGDYATDPRGAVARVAFVGALFGALFFTLAPLLRVVSPRFARSRLYQEAAAAHATRQAALVALLIVLNALLLLFRSWTPLNAALLLGVLGGFEVVALARR